MTVHERVDSILRTVRRYLHGRYHDIGEHFVYEDWESFGTLESQGETTYRCLDCGEEHKQKSSFSTGCGNNGYNTGGDTITRTARVASVQRTHIWFELVSGDRQGLHMRIPRYHTQYTETMETELATVTQGECYDVTFVAANGDRTRWYCGGLEPR